MIELITGEIHKLFPTNKIDYDREFIVHCSETVRNCFYMAFLKAGFVIPVHVYPTEETKWVSFQIPSTGKLKFIVDMEQGYKIEKVDENQGSKE